MQPRKILLLDDAIEDLRGIYQDILAVSKSRTVAGNYLKKLRHDLRHLDYTAEACPRYIRADGSETGYRFTATCHYLAFFQVTDNEVRIDRILHSRAEFSRHLHC